MIAISWGKPNPAQFGSKSGNYPLEFILKEVAEKHRVSVSDLVSQRRARYVAWPRQEAYWRARNETSLSLPAIGKHIGNRDHTTVRHGIRQHEKRLSELKEVPCP